MVLISIHIRCQTILKGPAKNQRIIEQRRSSKRSFAEEARRAAAAARVP